MSILAAVALDPLRRPVFDVAVELGRALDEELYLVHFTDEQLAGADARELRDDLQQRADDRDIAATVSIEHASHGGLRTGTQVAQCLLDFAADVDVSHIVMGHTAKGPIESAATGNAAFAVVDDAPVPVTVVPGGADVGT
jgi:nucleotide-binding universal stress UspA family protein